MKRFLPAALALAGLAAAQDTPPAYDTAALAPILSHSWAEGSCDAPPPAIIDWVIDSDGWAYRRALGFTPLTSLAFADGKLTEIDEVGIGRTTRVYAMREDGALRLWSDIFDPSFGENGQEGEPASQTVKDGKIVIGEDGQPVADPPETPALVACSPRTTLYTGEVVTTLGGTWADKEGGSCGKGTGALRFEFARPIPRVVRGAMGDMPESESYLMSAEKDGDGWIVTEGGAFDATSYRYTIGKDGTLNQAPAYEGEKPRVFEKCPG